MIGGRPEATYLLQVGVSLAPMDAALSRYRDCCWWRVPVGAGRRRASPRGGSAGFALAPLVSRGRGRAHDRRQQLERPAAGSRHRRRARSRGDAFNDTLARLEHRSARCGSSAPRSRTSCARRWRCCAARSSWPSSGTRRRDISGIRQPDRRDRPAHAADRSDPDAGARRVRPDSRSRWRRSTSAIWRPRSSNSSSRSRKRTASTCAASMRRSSSRRRRLAGAAAAQPARQRDEVHAAQADASSRRVAHGGTARVNVRDTGVGHVRGRCAPGVRAILPGRSRSARSSTTEGAGLGLSLAQWIVQSHHGTISGRDSVAAKDRHSRSRCQPDRSTCFKLR